MSERTFCNQFADAEQRYVCRFKAGHDGPHHPHINRASSVHRDAASPPASDAPAETRCPACHGAMKPLAWCPNEECEDYGRTQVVRPAPPAVSPSPAPIEDPKDSHADCRHPECGYPALCFMYPGERHEGCPRQAPSPPVRPGETAEAPALAEARSREMARRREEAIREAEIPSWEDFACVVGQAVGCLYSPWPSGNTHIVAKVRTLTASASTLREAAEQLHATGAQFANLAFNFKQQTSRASDEREILGSLQAQWDEAVGKYLAALRASSPPET